MDWTVKDTNHKKKQSLLNWTSCLLWSDFKGNELETPKRSLCHKTYNQLIKKKILKKESKSFLEKFNERVLGPDKSASQ